MLRARGQLAALTLVTTALLASAAGASAAVPTGWVTNGPVYSITHDSTRTYIGGDFTRVGRRTGHGVSLAPATGAWTGGAEIAGGQVRTVIDDAAGGWYVGGDFTHVNGQQRLGLAHILPSGALDPNFVANVENSGSARARVRALALQAERDGDRWLFVGGEFTRVGAKSGLANLAALDPASGAPSSWNPGAAIDANGTPAGAIVHTLDSFGVTVEVDPDGTATTCGSCQGTAAPTPMTVVAVGGQFTHLGAPPAGTKAAINRLGLLWGPKSQRHDTTTGTEPKPPKDVSGEPLTTSGGSTAWNVAASGTAGHLVRAVETDAPPPPPLGETPAATLTAVVYAGGVGGVGGSKTALAAHRLILTQTGTSAGVAATQATYNWTPCNNSATGCPGTSSVQALELADANLYVGGSFTKIGSNNEPRSNLAAFTPVTPSAVPTATIASPPLAWNPAAGALVRDLAVADQSVYVAGDFDSVTAGVVAPPPPASRPGLAAIGKIGAADAGAVREWDPSPSGALLDDNHGRVNAVAARSDAVFAGGSFSSVGAETRNRLAAFDDSGQLAPWNPDLGCAPSPCEVRSLVAAAGRVFAGGDFDTVGGDPRANVAAIDAGSGDAIDGWTPNPNWDVLALSEAAGRLYLGGAFTTVAGAERNRVAAVDATSGMLISGFRADANDNVYALEASCNSVLVGGGFTKIGGVTRNRIAALSADNGAPSAWNPDADSAVYDIERDGTTVYAAGAFPKIGGALRGKLAALDAATGKATDWTPSVNAGAVVRAIALSNDEVFAAGTFADVNSVDRSRIAAISRASGDVTSFLADADATAYAADVSAGGAVFGGNFRLVNAAAAHSLAGFTLTEQEPPALCSPPPPPAPPPPPPEPEPVPDPPTTTRQAEAPAPDVTAPVISLFKLKPRVFRVRGRSVFRWRLSEAGAYRIVIRRLYRNRRGKLRSRKVGAVGGLTPAGLTKRVFRGRVGRRALRPGRYRARLFVADAARNLSLPKTLRFTVKPRRRPNRARAGGGRA